MPAGRPSDYNALIASVICERIAHGESLKTICQDEDMPGTSSVFRWLDHHEEFRDKYARARETQMDTMVEEILSIADDGLNDFKEIDGRKVVNQDNIQRSKLRVDTRKWLMSKLAPKKYGDRTVLAGDDSAPLSIAVVHVAKQQES